MIEKKCSRRTSGWFGHRHQHQQRGYQGPQLPSPTSRQTAKYSGPGLCSSRRRRGCPRKNGGTGSGRQTPASIQRPSTPPQRTDPKNYSPSGHNPQRPPSASSVAKKRHSARQLNHFPAPFSKIAPCFSTLRPVTTTAPLRSAPLWPHPLSERLVEPGLLLSCHVSCSRFFAPWRRRKRECSLIPACGFCGQESGSCKHRMISSADISLSLFPH